RSFGWLHHIFHNLTFHKKCTGTGSSQCPVAEQSEQGGHKRIALFCGEFLQVELCTVSRLGCHRTEHLVLFHYEYSEMSFPTAEYNRTFSSMDTLFIRISVSSSTDCNSTNKVRLVFTLR